MGDSGAQLGDNRAQLFSPNSVRLFLDIDLNIKDLKRWCQIKTPWSRIWTLILLGGRLHLLRRTESLYLGRWTLWGPVLDGRPDMVRQNLSGTSTAGVIFMCDVDRFSPRRGDQQPRASGLVARLVE